MNLNTYCMFRAAPCARTGLLVVSGVRLTVPKLFENLALVAGSPKFARFRTLKTSQRNWNFVRSVSRVSLKRLISHCAKPGPRKLLRPQEPSLLFAGALNAVEIGRASCREKCGWVWSR